jgi:hypothetical protein
LDERTAVQAAGQRTEKVAHGFILPPERRINEFAAGLPPAEPAVTVVRRTFFLREALSAAQTALTDVSPRAQISRITSKLSSERI